MTTVFSNAVSWSLGGLAILVFTLRWRDQRSRLPLPPGPKGLPILGNLLDIPADRPWEAYYRWSKEFNSDIIYVNVAGTSIVVLSSFEVIADLLERRGALYSDRPQATMMNELMGWSDFFGFMNHDDRWRRQRKIFHETFHAGAVKQFDPHIQDSTHQLLRHLLKDPHDVMTHFRRFAVALIMETTYGISIETDDDPYVKTAEEALHGLEIACVPGTFLVDSISALKYIPSWFPGADFKRKARYWRNFTHDLRELPFAQTKRDMVTGTAALSFVSLNLGLVAEARGNNGNVMEKDIKETAAASYAAGADTTVSAMSTFALAMLKHPEAQKKAQAELDAVIGHGHLPSLSDAPALPYVSALVKEVLRLENVAPIGLPHRILVEDQYRGYRIPANSIVIGNVWALMHDEDIFPDSKAFKPERFLLDGKLNPDIQDPESAIYGFGRRICPGRHLANSSLWLTMASILATFDLKKAIAEDGSVIEPSYEYSSALVFAPPAIRVLDHTALSSDDASNRGHCMEIEVGDSRSKMFFKASAALLVTALAVSASPALQARQSCSQTYTVVSGDTCSAIEAKTGVSDAQLHSLNPSINSGCTNLGIGQVLCLSTGGSSTGGCTSTYTVVSGDTCSAIEAKTGVSDSALHAANPSINSGCTNLQIGQVLCLTGGSGGSSPPSGGIDGLATYYDPDGGIGACGSVLQNNDFIVALGEGNWDGGAHCGQTVNVQSPPDQSNTIQVTVQDLCPGCQGANGIDLAEGAMAALDSNYKNDGVISVVWSFA
ncbi:hypothetical protein MSAN_01971000 [Mycena sanguinolenta]|uniref:LysM domain-containing protein n=1 Tax=Mycena sanguinolenta TaxID=230812 RepID=A0A8H6XN86_9AGAR|nr:hypothetical protein MSAN_01971000 [Mycena sanguinolenta]